MSQLKDKSTVGATAVSADVLIFPTDARYDEARLAWNLAVDQRPPVVAMPRTVVEVQAVVDYATLLDLHVAVQGTGHGAAARGDLSGTVLLNTSQLTGVEVDVAARVARVKAGTIWADVVSAAVPHGLTALHGSAHDVGAVGYSLGGGIGWLARKYGLSASSIVSAEVVTADGEVVRADAETNAELFWALRGGGGSFGVVTEIEIRLYPVTEVLAGWLMWPVDRAAEVLATWVGWTESTPDEVASVGRLLQFPPISEMPEHFRGQQFVVVEAAYLGDAEAGRELLRPLLELGPAIDTFAVVPAEALRDLHQDPPQPVPAIGNGWLLGDLDAAAVSTAVEVAAMDGTSPLLSLELRQLGGALGTPSADAGVLSHIDAPFALFGVGVPMGPVTRGAIDERLDDLALALAAWSTGKSYLNFAERPSDPRSFYPDGVYDRLVAIREQVDPDGRFRANHPIG
jgi:FAD/FMN-containing dehydrogenase